MPEKKVAPIHLAEDEQFDCGQEQTAGRLNTDVPETAAQLHDLEEMAARLNDLLEKKTTQICDLEEKAARLTQILEDKVTQISDLEEKAASLNNILEDKVTQISDLEEKAAKLNDVLGEKVTQISDLEEKAARLNGDLDMKAARLCEMEEQASRLDGELEMKAAQLNDLEEKCAQLRSELEEKSTLPQHDVESSVQRVTRIGTYTNSSTTSRGTVIFRAETMCLGTPWAEEEPESTSGQLLQIGDREDSQCGKLRKGTVVISSPSCSSNRTCIGIEDFALHKVLGRGTFGKVLLAQTKRTGQYVAIKVVKKDNKYAEYAIVERRVLALSWENPFLAHLHTCFQTKEHLFFVMEYLGGGDLLFYLDSMQQFDVVRARFYAAEICCGLQFLHSKGIIYRDLKPENVMLAQNGHIKIIDFGISKDDMFGEERTKSYCGTLPYMAPEVLYDKGYSFSVDWWSFGVLLYEMLYGQLPFKGSDNEELLDAVCMDTPKYPHWATPEAKDLIEKLLEKEPVLRLTVMGDIRQHPFFSDIDWLALERREVEPPFKPTMTAPNDCRNFDEDLLYEKACLSHSDKTIVESLDQTAFANFTFVNPKWGSS